MRKLLLLFFVLFSTSVMRAGLCDPLFSEGRPSFCDRLSRLWNSMEDLGDYYRKHGEYSKARYWYESGFNKNYEGSGRCANQLGLMYLAGDGRAVDKELARKWFQEAALKGYRVGKYNYAIMLEEGRGGRHDRKAAREWYTQAAHDGYENARNALARMDEEDREAGEAQATDSNVSQPAGVIPITAPPQVQSTQPEAIQPSSSNSSSAKGASADQQLGGGLREIQRSIAEGSLSTAPVEPQAVDSNASQPADPAVPSTVKVEVASDEMCNLGSYYERLGDYSKACYWYERGFDEDYDNSDFCAARLGYIHAEGLGVKQDKKLAREWFLKAALKGNSAAKFSYARMLEFGEGGCRDRKAAREWYTQAAHDRDETLDIMPKEFLARMDKEDREVGEAADMYNLGRYYEKDGSYAISRQFYEYGFDEDGENSGLCAYQLGKQYYSGKEGLEKDKKIAREWYKKAALKGNSAAKYAYARMLEFGEGGCHDRKEARKWYTQAAHDGYRFASEPLARMDEQDREVGEAADMYNLGLYYAKKGGYDAAQYWFKRGFDENYENSGLCALQLGYLYAETLQGNREGNLKLAREWYKKGALKGDTLAKYSYAIMLEEGRGGRHDRKEAREWYTQAAHDGYEDAKEALAQLDEEDCQLRELGIVGPLEPSAIGCGAEVNSHASDPNNNNTTSLPAESSAVSSRALAQKATPQEMVSSVLQPSTGESFDAAQSALQVQSPQPTSSNSSGSASAPQLKGIDFDSDYYTPLSSDADADSDSESDNSSLSKSVGTVLPGRGWAEVTTPNDSDSESDEDTPRSVTVGTVKPSTIDGWAQVTSPASDSNNNNSSSQSETSATSSRALAQKAEFEPHAQESVSLSDIHYESAKAPVFESVKEYASSQPFIKTAVASMKPAEAFTSGVSVSGKVRTPASDSNNNNTTSQSETSATSSRALAQKAEFEPHAQESVSTSDIHYESAKAPVFEAVKEYASSQLSIKTIVDSTKPAEVFTSGVSVSGKVQPPVSDPNNNITSQSESSAGTVLEPFEAASLDDPRELYAQGKKYFDAKEYEKAEQCFQRGSAQEDIDCAIQLGCMYLNGTSIQKNRTAARASFERAEALAQAAGKKEGRAAFFLSRMNIEDQNNDNEQPPASSASSSSALSLSNLPAELQSRLDDAPEPRFDAVRPAAVAADNSAKPVVAPALPKPQIPPAMQNDEQTVAPRTALPKPTAVPTQVDTSAKQSSAPKPIVANIVSQPTDQAKPVVKPADTTHKPISTKITKPVVKQFEKAVGTLTESGAKALGKHSTKAVKPQAKPIKPFGKPAREKPVIKEVPEAPIIKTEPAPVASESQPIDPQGTGFSAGSSRAMPDSIELPSPPPPVFFTQDEDITVGAQSSPRPSFDSNNNNTPSDTIEDAVQYEHGMTGIEIFKAACVESDQHKAEQIFNSAKIILEEEADKDNLDSMYLLGFMLRRGIGGEKNAEQAANYLQKAADKGHSLAQYNLGIMFKKQPDNNPMAEYWIREAAKQGYAVAEFKMGKMLNKGHGVQRDTQEAYSFFEKAADHGVTAAQFMMGLKSYRGKKYEESAQFYQKAALQGHPKAMHNLAYLYKKGLGVDCSQEEAEYWLKEAVKKGYKKSAQMLAALERSSSTAASSSLKPSAKPALFAAIQQRVQLKSVEASPRQCRQDETDTTSLAGILKKKFQNINAVSDDDSSSCSDADYTDDDWN
jgi:TPR repeat protein